MQKLYIITAFFSAGYRDFQIFWLPDRHCFTYGEPRGIIPESEINLCLTEAESHARSVLGASGMTFPFELRAIEVSFLNGRMMAATAAGREWVRV